MLERCEEVKWKIGKLKQEAEAAFKQMKEHIAKVRPTLNRSEDKEELIVLPGSVPRKRSRSICEEGKYLASLIVESPEDEGQDTFRKRSKFGLLGEIISDNGKQFRDNPFKDWCEKLCIKQYFASVKHPQTNGLVERANRSLGEGIKARPGKENKNWLEEISHVLSAHRTIIKSGNGDTPFSLTYGMEAVILAEIRMPTFRTAEVDIAENDEALEINLDLIEEKREQAAIREAKSKRQMEKYYNTKVRNTSFKPGDLVYRSNEASRVEDTGKLGPKWEGPYEVTKALGKGSYKLKDRNGKEVPRTWNVRNLKKCYIYKV
ncbi:reverse transcriptase domain-containing protein [Tanacetum coccineum]